MIVCATPRCGGTIFSLNKASELGIVFSGELNVAYVRGLGQYGHRKASYHETGFQPEYSLADYVAHLTSLTAPDRLYLINEHVGPALPLSSFRIAARDVMRAFRSGADLVIRSTPDKDPGLQFDLIAGFCRAQLETNLLITHFCRQTGNDLQFFEDILSSRPSYPHLESYAQLRRLEKYFSYLRHLEAQHPLGP